MELVHPLRDHSEASGPFRLSDAGLGEPGDRQEHIEALVDRGRFSSRWETAESAGGEDFAT